MEKELLLNLINKYLSNQATAKEEELLLDYYNTLQKNKLKWDELEMGDEHTAGAELYSKVISEIKARESSSKKVFFMRKWFIAASVTLLLGVSASLFFYLRNDNSFLSAKNNKQRFKNTIAPGG